MKKNETSQVIFQKRSIAPVLRKMKAGDTEVFSTKQMASVKSSASLLATSLGMRFKTKTKRESGVFLVTKIA